MQAYRLRPRTDLLLLHSSRLPINYTTQHFPQLVAKGRGQGRLDIGYHFVIEQDGTTHKGLPLDAVGTHCPGFNHNSIGVCLAGGADNTDNFTDHQKEALRILWIALGSTLPVKAHTELPRFRGRACRCPAINMEDLRGRYLCA